jgi:exopolyphosphatase/guanosine-5'-triphosphate,3'-diphosphate pyrophosphatase
MENFTARQRQEMTFPAAVREYIYGTLSPLWAMVRQHHIQYIVLSGRAATLLGNLMGKERQDGVSLIRPDELRQFIYSFQGVTPFKLQQRYHLSENLANVLMPTLLLYYELLRIVDVDMIVLMGTTFTEGYSMYYVAEKTHNAYVNHQRQLLLDLARRLADRYVNNPAHSARIEEYASILFHAVYKQIGLNFEYNYLLQLASILHEAGKFINIRKHNLCTYNLIMETDLFSLTDDEKEILANIAYYGFDGIRDSSSENYDKLSPAQKLIAAKLITIFCLADSLDKSHLGKISRIWTELKDNELIVYYRSELDISLERWTFTKAAVSFAEVFGISPVLRKG